MGHGIDCGAYWLPSPSRLVRGSIRMMRGRPHRSHDNTIERCFYASAFLLGDRLCGIGYPLCVLFLWSCGRERFTMRYAAEKTESGCAARCKEEAREQLPKRVESNGLSMRFPAFWLRGGKQYCRVSFAGITPMWHLLSPPTHHCDRLCLWGFPHCGF